MSIKPLHKTILVKPEESMIDETHIQRFIGGAEHPEQMKSISNDHRLTLRIPKSLMERIDVIRAQRPGIISRNQCILELLQKTIE